MASDHESDSKELLGADPRETLKIDLNQDGTLGRLGKPAGDHSEQYETKLDPYEVLKIEPNPDGTIRRLGVLPTVPPTGEEPIPGLPVVTKDVPLNEDKNTWLRLYRPIKLPSNDKDVARLPLIVYFHSGAFMLFSADTVLDNEPCNRFCSELLTIVVSVSYRLAPENRLPAAYEDGAETMVWIKKQASDPEGEPWLRQYVDFSRCYLMGSSSGAVIAYNTTLRTLDMDIEPLKVSGLILNQPLFGGSKMTRSERKLTEDTVIPRCVLDLMWKLVLPSGANQDHEYSNPITKGSYSNKIGLLPRCLIRGFEGDPMLDRQMEFVKMLIKKGVQVTAHFSEFGFHLVDYIDPKRHLAMLSYMRDFI